MAKLQNKTRDKLTDNLDQLRQDMAKTREDFAAVVATLAEEADVKARRASRQAKRQARDQLATSGHWLAERGSRMQRKANRLADETTDALLEVTPRKAKRRMARTAGSVRSHPRSFVAGAALLLGLILVARSRRRAM